MVQLFPVLFQSIKNILSKREPQNISLMFSLEVCQHVGIQNPWIWLAACNTGPNFYSTDNKSDKVNIIIVAEINKELWAWVQDVQKALSTAFFFFGNRLPAQ